MKRFSFCKSLKARLLTGGILMIVIPLSMNGAISWWKADRSLTEANQEMLQEMSESAGNLVRVITDKEIKLAQELASRPETIQAAEKQSAAFSEVLKHVAAVSGDYQVIYGLDPSGKGFADSHGGKNIGIDLGDRDYFKKAKAEMKHVVGDMVLAKTTGKPVLPFCVPIVKDGKFIGAIATIMTTDALSARFAEMKVGKTGYASVINREGMVMIHPKAEAVFKLDVSKLGEMKDLWALVKSEKAGLAAYTYNGAKKIAAVSPVQINGWAALTVMDLDEATAGAREMRNVLALAGTLLLAVSAVLTLLFARAISDPVARAANEIREAAEQVSSAASQVASTSQHLAEGASEQASSLEETSASMEEMSSMTMQNADNLQSANSLMGATKGAVAKAEGSMRELVRSMDAIQEASEETGKIIRTIDEIAFQTNLLALNAAVEAARAGEAGAGFAVVAGEVRNLAMRAAESAKMTATLIETTTARVREGSALVTKTTDAFTELNLNAEKVSGLVAEIAAASQEQARGIEQVGSAIAEMDKVVQQTAANAEESASASEELNAQAGQMQAVAGTLMRIVTGSSDGSATAGADFIPAAGAGLAARITGAVGFGKKKRAGEAVPTEPDGAFKDF
ncbi:MAG: Cache 3/Cache 2 fusion domain-containing protein [Syntrophobacterales bacterium]|nr:Cache 3/Cache 2 fusion domain-containing protein [Syntrophobacterales bacterium]